VSGQRSGQHNALVRGSRGGAEMRSRQANGSARGYSVGRSPCQGRPERALGAASRAPNFDAPPTRGLGGRMATRCVRGRPDRPFVKRLSRHADWTAPQPPERAPGRLPHPVGEPARITLLRRLADIGAGRASNAEACRRQLLADGAQLVIRNTPGCQLARELLPAGRRAGRRLGVGQCQIPRGLTDSPLRSRC